MKIQTIAMGILLTLSSAVFAQETSTSTPRQSSSYAEPSLGRSAISAELLGRAGIYSFNYDYNFIPNLAAGAGVSFWSQAEGTASATVTLVPVYMNAYLWTGKHRPFVTAGVTFGQASVTNSDASSNEGGRLYTLGAGYELRTDAGFMMRLAGYRMGVGDGGTGFWPGIAFGGAF